VGNGHAVQLILLEHCCCDNYDFTL